MFNTTCFDIWRKEATSPKIITLNKYLDKCLNGGIGLGLVTELCGGPGVGKTQMCLQLCVNVQFPELVGGLAAKAFYIDSNQGFSPYRLKEICKYTSQHVLQAIQSIKDSNVLIEEFDENSILNNIFYVYCRNYLELITEILNLRNLLNTQKKLKLIIIDSFAHIMRYIEDVELRTRCAYEVLTEMKSIASEFGIAFVITNELTTRYTNGDWFVAPAMGDLHTHKINQRLILNRDISIESHTIVVDKSVQCDRVSVPFQIKANGIRGLGI